MRVAVFAKKVLIGEVFDAASRPITKNKCKCMEVRKEQKWIPLGLVKVPFIVDLNGSLEIIHVTTGRQGMMDSYS